MPGAVVERDLDLGAGFQTVEMPVGNVGLDLQRPVADHANDRFADLHVGPGLGQSLGDHAGVGRANLRVIEVDLGKLQISLGAGDRGIGLVHLGLNDGHLLARVREARLVERRRFLQAFQALELLARER